MKASDIDMQDLALIYDDEYGPDYVAGILASEFPTLDTDAAYEKVLGMLKEAARRGEEDYPLNFLANRIAELGAMKENKMRITKSQLRKIIQEELLKEMPDYEANDRAMEETAFELGRYLVGAPHIVKPIVDALLTPQKNYSTGETKPQFPIAAAALQKGNDESQGFLDDQYIGVDDD